jgi:hypothetical protein
MRSSYLRKAGISARVAQPAVMKNIMQNDQRYGSHKKKTLVKQFAVTVKVWLAPRWWQHGYNLAAIGKKRIFIFR